MNEPIITWRVGSKVPLNVYEGDRPVCQCHSEEDAARIVAAMNGEAEARKDTERLDWLIGKLNFYDDLDELIILLMDSAPGGSDTLCTEFRAAIDSARTQEGATPED